jgi:hypothetical protein
MSDEPTTIKDLYDWINAGGLPPETVLYLDGDGTLMADVPGKTAVTYLHIGFEECDEPALPFSLAIGYCDIGEATMRDGSKVLTTWGLNLPVEEQEWFIKETRFHPIWIGADDGACELILGESGSCDPWVAWIREGLKIGENPAWEEVSDE